MSNATQTKATKYNSGWRTDPGMTTEERNVSLALGVVECESTLASRTASLASATTDADRAKYARRVASAEVNLTEARAHLVNLRCVPTPAQWATARARVARRHAEADRARAESDAFDAEVKDDAIVTFYGNPDMTATRPEHTEADCFRLVKAGRLVHALGSFLPR